MIYHLMNLYLLYKKLDCLSNNLENLSGDKAAKGGYDDVVQLSKLGTKGQGRLFYRSRISRNVSIFFRC